MADKKTCFVIMPFTTPYSERCERIYKPAIMAAGLEPVLAGGPGVDKIIDSIEDGINNSLICLVDISENNPNVWNEMGFALKHHGRMVFVCDEEERELKDLPFDIRDRRVIFYRGKMVDSDQHACDGFRLDIEQDLLAKAAKATASIDGGGTVASSQNDVKGSPRDVKLDAAPEATENPQKQAAKVASIIAIVASAVAAFFHWK